MWGQQGQGTKGTHTFERRCGKCHQDHSIPEHFKQPPGHVACVPSVARLLPIVSGLGRFQSVANRPLNFQTPPNDSQLLFAYVSYEFMASQSDCQGPCRTPSRNPSWGSEETEAPSAE